MGTNTNRSRLSARQATDLYGMERATARHLSGFRLRWIARALARRYDQLGQRELVRLAAARDELRERGEEVPPL